MRFVLAFVSTAVAATAQATWTQLTPPTSPAARESHAMVHEPVAQRTFVLFGRLNGALYAPGPFWSWDGTAWTSLTNTVTGFAFPTGTCGASDDGAGAMLLFGGYQPGIGIGGGTPMVVDRTWRVQPTSGTSLHFTLLSPPTSPGARQAPALVRTNQGVLLFGGADVTASSFFGDTWLWNGTTWTAVATASQPPARAFHAMAFDPVRNVVVLFGGATAASSVADDTWEFDGASWQQRFPVHQPPPRCRAACAYSPLLGRVVVFGGGATNGGANLADAWTWDGVDWRALPPVAAAPSARQGAAMVFDPLAQRLVLFGGRDGSTYHGDTWTLDAQASPASYAPFGAGCPGPNALVPALAPVGGAVPALGTTSQLRVTNLPATLTQPIFVLGTSNTFEATPPSHPLPFDLGVLGWPGCQQLVSHDVLDAVPTLATSAQIPFVVPLAAHLLGFTFHAQVFVLYAPSGAAVSNALTGVVGF